MNGENKIFMIIDSHTHIGYGDYNVDKFYRASDLTDEMRKGGVTHAVVFSDYEKKRKRGSRIGAVLEEIKNYENLFAVGNWFIGFTGKDFKELEELLKSNKIRGVKIYLGYEAIWPTDKRLNSVYKLCQKYGYPAIFHTGLLFPPEGAFLKHSQPLPIDEVAAKYPELKIIIAHSGYPWTIDASAVIYKNKNVYADLSGFMEFSKFSKESMEYFTGVIMAMRGITDNLNKFLFGTDFPIGTHGDYVSFIKQLPIAEEEKDNIFFRNASKLFKIPAG